MDIFLKSSIIATVMTRSCRSLLRRTLLTACLLFATTATAGYRLQVRVVPLNAPAGAQSIGGAEVCVYHAGDPFEYFSKFFHSDQVRCYPAEKILDMPAGVFLLYAHVGNRFVSVAPYLIQVTAPEEEVLRRYAVEVVPAATLDFTAARKDLPDGTYPVVYLPNDDHPRFVSNVLPLPHGSATMLVPADQTVVPLLAGRDGIDAVAVPVRVAAGEQRVLDEKTFASANAAVVALVTLKNFAAPLPAPQLEPLRVALVRNDDDSLPLAPVLQPRSRGLFDRSLLIFRGVRRGGYRLRIDGDHWLPTEIDVKVDDVGVVRPARPLTAEPAAVLSVRWTADGVGSTFLQAQACGEQKEPLLTVGLKLSYCGTAPESNRPCSPVRFDETAVTAQHGEFTTSRLPAGEYEAELDASGARVWSERLTLAGAECRSAAARFRVRTVHGRVRKDSNGVRARVTFASGAAVAADTGEFVAVVARPVPAHTPVDVVACDGSFSFTSFVDRDLDDGDRFDVDVPNGSLRVEVTTGGAPLAAAKVTVGVLMPDSDDATMAMLALPPTGGDGITEKQMLVEGLRYRACATHPGYERVCSAPIVLGPVASSIPIVLTPSGAHDGRIVSERGFVGARVYFVDPQGTVREEAAVAPEGSFTAHESHAAPEYAVLISLSHPLAVVGLPVVPADPLEIQLRGGPINSFNVVLKPSRTSAVITLQVGANVVPWTIIDRYLAQTGSRAVLRPGRSARFAGVLADLPVFVVVAPELLPPNVPIDAVFHRPEYAQLPRLPVQGGMVEVE